MTETKKTPIERAKHCVASRIESLTAQADGYGMRMSIDYLRFFEESAGVVYAMRYELRELKRFMEDLDGLSLDEAVGMTVLKHQRYVADLLERPLARHSTNEFANIAYSIELHVKQSLVHLYDRLIAILTEE